MMCNDCNRTLWECPSCGGLRCACPNPFQYAAILKAEADALAEGKRRPVRPRLMQSQHYDRSGNPYPAQFIDGFIPEYSDEDITSLIEEPFS